MNATGVASRSAYNATDGSSWKSVGHFSRRPPSSGCNHQPPLEFRSSLRNFSPQIRLRLT